MALLEQVILRDTRANQPAPGDVAVGILYCVTDEQYIIERNSGSAWQQFGYGTAGTGTPTEYNAGSSGASKTIDWDNGAQQRLTLTADCTLTFSSGTAGGTYRLILVQDGTGGWAITWPADIAWEDSVDPTLVTDAGNPTLCSFVYTAAGSGGYLGFATTRALAV